MAKVAIVGLGKMGLSHLAIANATAGLEVVAICDPSQLVGTTIAKYGRFPYFASFEEVIALPGLDAVIIATPTRLHEQMIRAALDRNLHVFCEKPLTLSAAASEELAALARQKGLVTQVGYHNRFLGTFGEVERLIRLGTLGRITHALAESYGPVVLKPSKATWRSSAVEGGGCLYDYAAHPLNLLNWYFGEPLACSGSKLKGLFSAEVDDEVYSTISFPNEVTAQLSVNWSDESVRKMTTKISIWGEHGKLVADRQEIQVFLRKGAVPPAGYGRGWTVRYITELTDPVAFYLRGEEYSAQLENFSSSIAGGKATSSDLEAAAVTDRSIEMIRADAQGKSPADSSAQIPLSMAASGRKGVFSRFRSLQNG